MHLYDADVADDDDVAEDDDADADADDNADDDDAQWFIQDFVVGGVCL